MTPEQELSLTGGGDCFSHYHSEDRRPTQDFLHGLHAIAATKVLSGDATLTGVEDFLQVDTRTSNVTITLPKSNDGLELEITKRYANNTLIVLPASGDTILDATGVTFSLAGTSIRFRAFDHNWTLI